MMWKRAKWASALGLLLSVGAASVARAHEGHDHNFPDGFSESLFAGDLKEPADTTGAGTAMAFAPDGRLFVTQQEGRVRVIKNGVVLATDFLDLRGRVHNFFERGLLGVAFDPQFASNRWVYFYYTVPQNGARRPFNRVSRFRASATNPDVAEAGSEQILFELDDLSDAGNHNGGAMHFGADGKLYVAVGDNGNGSNAQADTNLLGKMLRLNPDGTIPTDNPFYNSLSGRNRAIWAKGLRNPFTFAFVPGSSRMLINDVGQATWEEINEGVAGANYGWPFREGATTEPQWRSPLFSYIHGDSPEYGQGMAVTGGVFYNGSQFPAAYRGKYFYADFVKGWIRVLDANAAPGTVSDPEYPAGASRRFGAARDNYNPVDLDIGPDGALYVLSRGQAAVFRIAYSPAPAISSHPQSQTVAVGQSTTFAVSASGASLSYQWQRNGANIAGATAASYTFPAQLGDNGAQYRVVVANASGTATSNAATLTVTTGNAPVPAISAPATSFLYRAGQPISFAGSASDPEDGALAASALTWRIDFHHDTHFHPGMPSTSGIASGTFDVPTVGETSDNVWYRVYLTARDSSGATASTFRDVFPRRAQITLAARAPQGLELTLDGAPLGAPATFRSVSGIVREIGAPSPQTLGGVTYTFKSWSDGGAATHAISTPEADTTYTALFSDNRPPVVAFDGRFGDNYSYKSLSEIFGMASDVGVGIERIELSLRRPDGFFWNGSAWVAAPSTFTAPFSTSNGTSFWRAALPALAEGTYTLRATAFDAGGASTSTAATRIIIDNAAPVVAFTAPRDGGVFRSLAQARGTVSDAGGGVQSVLVQLQRLSDGAFYNAATSSWGAASAGLSTRGTFDWTATLPALADGRYRVTAISSDYTGNTSAGSASFSIDNAAPTVAFDARFTLNPASFKSFPILNGTAGDVSNIARVAVQIRRAVGGGLWNGTAFAAAGSLDAVVSGNTWALSSRLPSGTGLVEGDYVVTATAFDVVGNSSSASRTLRIDRTAPRLAVAQPLPNSVLKVSVPVRGTASDVGGVQVLANLYRLAFVGGKMQWQVWAPSTGWVLAFNPARHDLAVARTTGAATLNWTLGLPPLVTGRYAVRAIAVDRAGNRTATPLVPWTLDRNPPTVSITAPVANAALGATPVVTGRASDIGTGPQKVTLVLLREGVGYWTGSGWSRTFSAVNERPAIITRRVVANSAAGTRTDIEWLLRLPTLPPGRYKLRASTSDGAPWTAFSPFQNFTITSSPRS